MTSPEPTARSSARIAVIGTGYVGLSAGVCLAHMGHEVVCADVDVAKIERLRRGEIPIVEAGLPEMFAQVTSEGLLQFVVGARAAVPDAAFVFLCVPTPEGDDGSADLSYVEAVAAEIAPHLAPNAIIINKSTVPVGAASMVEHIVGRDDVAVLSNPEFLREGSAIADFLEPDRVVIGGSDGVAAERLADLYRPLGAPIQITDAASAETIKYAANGFLALKLSFVNSVAAMCEAVGADVHEVVKGIGSDPRVGDRFLQPGPGWGGSCFPKDSRALIAVAAQHGYDFTLMRNAITVNREQRERMVRKAAAAVGRGVAGFRPLEGTTIAALGLTYKAGTDDMRESPALAIVERLVDLGAQVAAYDPTTTGPLNEVQRMRLGSLVPMADPYAAVAGADVVMILTEWPEFALLDLERIARLARGDVLIDTRNMLEPDEAGRAGLVYSGVGRPDGGRRATDTDRRRSGADREGVDEIDPA